MAPDSTSIDLYQRALRARFLHLAGRRPLSVLACETQLHRNTLSAWVAEWETQHVTVRTLRKIENWCVEQEGAQEPDGPAPPTRGAAAGRGHAQTSTWP